MRVGAEFRGSLASFRRASNRSSSERLSFSAVAFNAARLAANCFTSLRTRSLRLTALFLAMGLAPCPFFRSGLGLGEREVEFPEELTCLLVGFGSGADDDVHAPD